MEEDEQEDPRIVLAKKNVKELEEEVKEEGREAEELHEESTIDAQREQQEDLRKVKEAIREEAHGIVEYIFTKLRRRVDSSYREGVPDLELDALPLYEKVFTEDLEKGLGEKLPKEIVKAVVLAVLAAKYWEYH